MSSFRVFEIAPTEQTIMEELKNEIGHFPSNVKLRLYILNQI